jgi:hypothetical protein
MDKAQGSWSRMADAEIALHAALAEYANALYDHNVSDRGIAPLGAYRDATATLASKLDAHKQEVQFDLQMRVAESRAA